ncbi:MAG: hypothetical protein ACKOFN_05655 [Vulcanococcus sp.]
MSQLTIKLSDKADALIAQLQKEIFNRRRKKVSPAGVVETLVESGAKSQSDKRFATSWKNLVTDIEKAAKEANAHGVKPAGISDAEWALILSHRSRASAQAASKPKVARKAPAVKKPTTAKAKAKPSAAKASTAETTAKTAKAAAAAAAQPKTTRTRAAAKPKVSKASKTSTAARPSSRKSSAAGGSSVAKRMAKAVSRLNASGVAATSATSAAPTANGNGAVALV